MSSYKLREQLFIGAGRADQEEATMMLLRKLKVYEGFPGSSDGKESACNSGDPGFNPWVGKIPWRRKWQLTSVFMPGESHRQTSLVGNSPWGRKESDTTE